MRLIRAIAWNGRNRRSDLSISESSSGNSCARGYRSSPGAAGGEIGKIRRRESAGFLVGLVKS
jgi:hypothetical protein